MPRKSPFAIVLSKEERVVLESQHASIRHRIAMSFERRSYCSRRKASPTTSSLLAWTRRARLSASGASDSPSRDFLAWSRNLGAGVPPSFPPSVVVQVKALACELPHRLQLPLSRLSLSEIRREVITQRGWQLRLAERPCGAGSVPMRSALGDIAVGSSHAIQISRPRLGASSICRIAFGRDAL
jgi:hypothetical protein